MCDYSLHNVKTRPAKVGDKLVTREFIGTLTRGFASPEDLDVAVCVLPGTELSFSDNVRRIRPWPWSKNVIHHKTAIFRQVANPNVQSRCPGISRRSDRVADFAEGRARGHRPPATGDRSWV
jgi:hypothetical protein